MIRSPLSLTLLIFFLALPCPALSGDVLSKNLFVEAQKSHAAAELSGKAEARDLRLKVKSAILMNMNTGEILYEQTPDDLIPPASLTKILTLYIVFDAIQNGALRPWETVNVSRNADDTFGSTMSLHAGEQVSVTELIKGISIASANDGCVAVAEYLENGNIDAFVRRMNETARALGMGHTTFVNPNGLPAEGQLTTARDLLKLARIYLDRFPKALAIHSQQTFVHNRRTKHNANTLLGKYEGVDGLKTGFVQASGYNIAVTAKRDDVRLLAVVLGARNPGTRERETARLLDAGFGVVKAQTEARARLAAADSDGVRLAAAPGEDRSSAN